jgi:hypothetical protein
MIENEPIQIENGIRINDYSIICNRIIILDNISIIPNVSAKITVSLYNDGIHLCNEEVLMEGEAYNNWGSDDTYLENFILNYYGMTRRV